MVTRRRPVEPAGYTGPLPARIAAGPLVELWPGSNPAQHPEVAAITTWKVAAGRWSEDNGYGPSGWRDLLPPGVLARADARYLELLAERYAGRRPFYGEGRHR